MSLNEYFGDWLNVIDEPELLKVVSIINTIPKEVLAPCYNDIFKAFTMCTLKDCRVVFLGQDPYPQKGVATGILFGNHKDTKDLSPSLKVVRSSIVPEERYDDFDITMEHWARQGILMINSALTCEINHIGKHFLLWKPFMSKFLLSLSAQKEEMVYVLFGNQAQSFKPYINGKWILNERHPAFYARVNMPMPSRIFHEVNYYIKGESIQWYK